MIQPSSRVLTDFPYPVAYPYRLVFDPAIAASQRRWALCFTEYQLLRTVCLPLVSQYLRDEIDRTAKDSIGALNRAIAAIRSPFFSDWIALLYNLRRHLPRVGIQPVFPQLAEALKGLNETAERPVGLRGNHRLTPLEAILALRNGSAHGGLPDEDQAAQHVEQYLPVLHQILQAFDFLGDATLCVCSDRSETLASGRARLHRLRGADLVEPAEEDLSDELVTALEESPSVLMTADGVLVPLYPLASPVAWQEPLYLYDGHYGIQVHTRQQVQERSYIYYLGIHHRAEGDAPPCARLKELLARRDISFFLSKDQTAPWTIADSGRDYSQRTLDDLLGRKYFPACYVPFQDIERHMARFLRVPDAERWPAETTRPRYVNGLILVGLAGAGKTALLARQVESLLAAEADQPGRENPNLVLLLRGDGIALRPEGMSLFRDVAEKLGIAVEGAGTGGKVRSGGGFSSWRELLDHLHGRWKQDRVPGRRLILVLDALNEAPLAEKVIDQALEMIAAAACFPWCKIIISTRHEWLSIWSGKAGAQETSRLEQLRPWLYCLPSAEEQAMTQGPPVLMLEPFTAAQAREVYGRYQCAAGAATGQRIPACRTDWTELPAETQDLLANPLYLHLFMEAFDGREAEALTTVPALFQRYVARAVTERPGLGGCISAVIGYLLDDLDRTSADLTDDDCNAIRRVWAAGLSAEESRLLLSPVEGLEHEGLVTKRVREEGGGYRFLFQAVAEYLIYRYLADHRAADQDKLAYWTPRASVLGAFPEYAGAFAYLFRDWAAHGRLSLAGRLLERGAGWLGDVMTTFLLEQARIGYQPGRGSEAAVIAARTLRESGASRTANALHVAGHKLWLTRFALSATEFYAAAVSLREALWAANPENVGIGNGLGMALNNLGILLRVSGRVADAERALRGAVEISESLWAANPDNVGIGHGLGWALNGLGNLLRDTGRVAEAERACQRSVEILGALWAANTENVEIRHGLGASLTSLGNLLRDTDRMTEAEAALRRSVEILQVVCEANPENIKMKAKYAECLCDLGRFDEAERLVREVLERVPDHPDAKHLLQSIALR